MTHRPDGGEPTEKMFLESGFESGEAEAIAPREPLEFPETEDVKTLQTIFDNLVNLHRQSHDHGRVIVEMESHDGTLVAVSTGRVPDKHPGVFGVKLYNFLPETAASAPKLIEGSMSIHPQVEDDYIWRGDRDLDIEIPRMMLSELLVMTTPGNAKAISSADLNKHFKDAGEELPWERVIPSDDDLDEVSRRLGGIEVTVPRSR